MASSRSFFALVEEPDGLPSSGRDADGSGDACTDACADACGGALVGALVGGYGGSSGGSEGGGGIRLGGAGGLQFGAPECGGSDGGLFSEPWEP